MWSSILLAAFDLFIYFMVWFVLKTFAGSKTAIFSVVLCRYRHSEDHTIKKIKKI